MRLYLRDAVKYRSAGWELDHGWIQRTLEDVPGGATRLADWLVMHDGDDQELDYTAGRLLVFLRNRAAHIAGWGSVAPRLSVYLTGEIPVPSADRWLRVAQLVESVPSEEWTSVEATGTRWAEDSSFPALYYQRLADMGVTSPALRRHLIEQVDAVLRSGSPDVLASWKLDEHVAHLILSDTAAVPEDLVRKLEMCRDPAYRSVGLRVRVKTATRSEELVEIVRAISTGRIASPWREYVTIALLEDQPDKIAASISLLLRTASFRSYFDRYISEDIPGSIFDVANGLNSGDLIWDVEQKLVRKP